MICYRCSKEVTAEQLFCPHCGAMQQKETPRKGVLVLTKAEAKKGCVKFLRMEGLAMPLRFELRPGIKDGHVLTVKNARFLLPDGRETAAPLEVTLLVVKDKKKKRRPAFLFLLLAAVALILYGMARNGVFDKPGRTEEEIRQEATETIPHFEERYFLSQMSTRDTEIVLALYEAMMNFSESCKIPLDIHIERFEDLFWLRI